MALKTLRLGALLAATVLSLAAAPLAHAADEDQFLNASRGTGSRLVSMAVIPLTIVAGATVQNSYVLPVGSQLMAIRLETATAISGAPTNINVRSGSTAAGNDYLADTDAKAQGHLAPTFAAAFDVLGATANAPLTMNFQAAAVGGTAPAGTINVVLEYAAPVR